MMLMLVLLQFDINSASLNGVHSFNDTIEKINGAELNLNAVDEIVSTHNARDK